MKIVWKLLRKHISPVQFAGFFFANLIGMIIVLFGIQFYFDVRPVFDGDDGLIKKDYLIVSKRVKVLSGLTGGNSGFTAEELQALREQPFVKSIGEFKTGDYKVMASVNMGSSGLDLSTQLFFESVPDEYVDVQSGEWRFGERNDFIPIIIPKNYLNLYNFGFAQSHSLPQLSEGVLGMVSLLVTVSGNGESRSFTGRIVGFSNRLNTILVPQSFIDWSNSRFGGSRPKAPSRLIVEVDNPGDSAISSYFREHALEVEGDKLDAGKTNYFLTILVGIVLSVGLLISILSFFLLMLSIYLLLQKNTQKLEDLLLLGYTPGQTARPYQILILVMNAGVLLLSFIAVSCIRLKYMSMLTAFGAQESGSMLPSVISGVFLFGIISVINIYAVKHKIMNLWIRK